ncbi:MAG TPA: CAP domain-containing protein [Planctomycetaceae bacterium]|nr:CAP domain-containing protein [Planctomycetaceae bacterium]
MGCRNFNAGALLVVAIASVAAARAANVAEFRIEPDRALLEIHLPDHAVLEIQGIRTNSSGAVRHYRSTPLVPGERYVYDVRAVWRENGQTRNVVREVRVQAGKHVVVDFHPDGLFPDERAVLELTNARRVQAGLPPLTADPRLVRAARQHSANMARHNTISHTLDGATFVDRLRLAGYAHTAAGENCAQGQPTPAAAVESWMHSPGHRANILNPRYTDIGIGIQVGPGGDRFYTQLFARPAGLGAGAGAAGATVIVSP